jgi:N-acyl-D-aspartate/D-glutamate deacylase
MRPIFGVSDGGAHTKFFTGGRYSTEALIKIGRDNNLMSLEELHWRLSAHPAKCAGFRNRGTLVEGAWADIVVYDLNKLAIKPKEIVHDFPCGEWRRVQQAEGYRRSQSMAKSALRMAAVLRPRRAACRATVADASRKLRGRESIGADGQTRAPAESPALGADSPHTAACSLAAPSSVKEHRLRILARWSLAPSGAT